MMLGVCMALGVVHTASALTISATGTGGAVGGNPAGLTIYQVQLSAPDQGQSFDLHWGYTSATDDVSADGSFKIDNYENGHFDLRFSLTNTSTVTNASNPRLTAFGFNINPDLHLDSVDLAGNKLDSYTTTASNFSAFQSIDFCVYGGL